MKLSPVAILCHLALLDGASCRALLGGRNNNTLSVGLLPTTSLPSRTLAATRPLEETPQPYDGAGKNDTTTKTASTNNITNITAAGEESASNATVSLNRATQPDVFENANEGSSAHSGPPKNNTCCDGLQVKVKPSLVECTCNGDGRDPSCLSIIHRVGSKMEPIVILVPETTTVSGEKTTTTVTQDLEDRKCHEGCSKGYRPPEASQLNQGGCASGDSCRQNGDKS